jgi:hypothetical protein
MLIGSPKKKGTRTQCLLVRYAYVEYAYKEVWLYIVRIDFLTQNGALSARRASPNSLPSEPDLLMEDPRQLSDYPETFRMRVVFVWNVEVFGG